MVTDSRQYATRLWEIIVSELDAGVSAWRQTIDGYGQVAAVEKRSSGKAWNDDEVFKALLFSILSNSVDWSKIETNRAAIQSFFLDFNLAAFATRDISTVNSEIVPWFKARRAGAPNHRRSFESLIQAARHLTHWSKIYGSAEHYFTSIAARRGDDAKQVAIAIGTTGDFKLPGLGPALAAEALRNMGFDLAKPDRHINRAAGSFALVTFARWPNRSRTTPPSATTPEFLDVMTAMESWAAAIGEKVTFLDNAVWILCAKSGLHATNDHLASLAERARLSLR